MHASPIKRADPKPALPFLSTRTKPLMHGVASRMGLSTYTCSILLTSCWKAFFRWTGIGQQGVCFGVTPGSSCMCYGGPGNLPIPQEHLGNASKSFPYLGNSGLGIIFFCGDTVLSVVELWTATWHLVLCGWSTELVIKLALGGR